MKSTAHVLSLIATDIEDDEADSPREDSKLIAAENKVRYMKKVEFIELGEPRPKTVLMMLKDLFNSPPAPRLGYRTLAQSEKVRESTFETMPFQHPKVVHRFGGTGGCSE